MSINRKVAVVTGASRGIGKAIAESFAKEGIHLCLCARHHEPLTTVSLDLQKKYPEITIITQAFDIRNEPDISSFIEKVFEKFGKVDYLINNAGITRPNLLENTPKADLDLVIDTNVKGPFLMIKHVLPKMKELNTGHIINISSVAGLSGYPIATVYCASKFALEGMTAALKEELSTHDIHLTNIRPGPVSTDMWKDIPKDIDLERITQPEEVASAVLFALKNAKNCMIENLVITPRARNY